jgi:hypothetical protein
MGAFGIMPNQYSEVLFNLQRTYFLLTEERDRNFKHFRDFVRRSPIYPLDHIGQERIDLMAYLDEHKDYYP